MQIKEMMAETPTTVTRQSSLQEAAKKMKDHDCGALPVVGNEDGRRPIGMVSQADLARRAPEEETADVVSEVSEPTGKASRPSAEG